MCFATKNIDRDRIYLHNKKQVKIKKKTKVGRYSYLLVYFCACASSFGVA